MHRMHRLVAVLLSGAFLASCGSGPMKGAFSRQLLEEVSQQVAANEVPQPRADGGGGETFAPGSETNEVLVFPVGSALLRSEDGVEYAYIFSQPSVTTSDGNVFPEVVQTWVFDTDDGLVEQNVVRIASIVSDDSIAVAGGQADVTLRNDLTGAQQANIQTDFYRLEAQYSGLAYWIVHSDVYFGLAVADYAQDDFRMGFYGLATPSSGQPALGLAAYEGRAFGSYMRNIPADESVAAADRFLIIGDVTLLADFGTGVISGNADLDAYTNAFVPTVLASKVAIAFADGTIESDGSFEGSNVSVMADGAGTNVLSDLTEDLPPSGAAEEFKGMFTGPEADELVGRAALVGTGYALRFGFVAKEVEVQAEEIPEVILTKIEEDLQSGETEQPTAKPGQNFAEDTNTTVVFPTEEEEAIVRTNNGNTFVLIFEEENEEEETVVQTWTFNTSDPAQTVADNVSEIQGILGTSLDISGSRSEVKRRDSGGVERDLNVDAYLFEGSHAGFGLWLEKPEEFFGPGSYSLDGTPVAARFYGLATPSADLPSGGTAAYEGQAAGAFVRNYISGTVAASDRYTIGGDIELEVDFGNSTLGGSADLQAYTTAFAATDPVSEVSVGLLEGIITRGSVSYAGSVAISRAGTEVLSGLTAGLSPVQDGFSGIFAGPAADETVGRAEFRTGTLALQFGFAASQQSTHFPAGPVAAGVLADVRARLGGDEEIAQPTAGSESFDDPTSSDLAFPALASSSIIRSADGSEYIYAFKSAGSVQDWRFAVGSEAVAGNIARIISILNSSEVQAVGSRANASLDSSTRNIDSYIFEGSYAGFGLIVQEPEEFFGSGAYDVSDSRVGLHFYGLATSASSLPQGGLATYEGKAAGGLARNVSNSGIAAAADRFVVSGDVNLQASFAAGSIAGSVDLIAHALDISTQSRGALMLMLDRGTIQANGYFAGSARVKAGSDGAFASFTPEQDLAESSGYTGLIAGGAAQEISGRVQLTAGSSNLQVGFLTVRENEFGGITPSVLSAARTSVDTGTTIPRPPAGSESFADETADDLTFPAGEGAVIRSKDGSEYAYVFKEGSSTQAWTFPVSEPGTAAAAKANALRALAGEEYAVTGGRDAAADGYIFESRYAGLGIWAQGAADAFFGSGSYRSADLDLSIYGLATPPANIPESVALYVGRAFGVYLKNIQQDGNAAAADRFVVSGTVEIEADFEQNAIGGSVQLVAHRLTSTEAITGSGAVIGLAEASQTNGRFAGDASVQSAQGVFASLGGVTLDNSSGYSGFLAGPDADELAGKALLLASNGSQRLEFGFIGEFFNVIPIDDAILEATEARVLAGDEIEQPEAGTENFDDLTAEPLVFPAAAGGAIVRSRDGFEYAYIFREGSPAAARTWHFAASGRNAVASRVTSIRAELHEDIEAYGLRSEVSRLDASDVEETFDADIYVLEAAHAGSGLLVEKPAEFFGSDAYSTAGTPVGAVFYGLVPATIPSLGTASYSGSAVGGYMRNIQVDGSVDAADRFLISGDVELIADFTNGLIGGSAALTAHSLNLSAERGTAVIGFGAAISSGSASLAGDVWIAGGGTNALSALSAGLSPDGSSSFNGLLAGPDSGSIAGRAVLREADQALLFGFAASADGAIHSPANPIAASVLAGVRTQVDNGTAIAQPAAGSENFDSATANDLAFPAAGDAIIRSTDGSEHAYVFKADGAVHTWRFAAGSPSVAANVVRIRNILDSTDIDASGSRSVVSRGGSIFSADAYIFVGSYAGFGLLAEEPERFFDSASDDYQARRVAVRHYGLGSPASAVAGAAVYAGKAAGGYMRNIKPDGTVEGGDRFLISGTVALTADFGNSTILGSADLIAHSLDISETRRGEIKIGISGSITDGDVDILTTGTEMLGGLTAGLSADEGSGVYASLLAGATAQELAGNAEFLSGNQGLLFGFIAKQSSSSGAPASPIAASVLTSARTQVDNGSTIAQPTAGTESFDSATANDLIFPVAGGAVIRSKDGSEYAYVFKADSVLETWRFNTSSTPVQANADSLDDRLDSSAIDVSGSRSIVSRASEFFYADLYAVEASYSGFGLLIEDSDQFFSNASDGYAASGVSVVSYGFADSSAAGYASYTGEAAGSYMRNVQSNGTVAAADRFVISGEIALTADLLNDTISGSADLIAHSLDISATRRGEIKIGISGQIAEGDVDILTTGTEMLSGLTANLGHDAGSGVYASQLAGGTGQEYSASAEFLSGSQSLVFGFTAARSAAFVNIPAGPIAASVLTDTNTKVDAGTTIAVPIAGDESFDPDTPTANDVVLQNTDGGKAVIRAKDGSEYAFAFKKPGSSSLLSWRFASNTPQLSQRISKIHAFDSSSARTIGSNAQVKDGDNVFDVNAFVLEQSYSGLAVLIEDPEVFFDDSVAYSTAGTGTSTFAYGLRPMEGITSGYGNYSGRLFGTYMDGITNSQAQGANRYAVRGDADFEVDFRENDLLGLFNIRLADLDLDSVSGTLVLHVRVTNARDFLSTARSTTQYSLGSRFGPFGGSVVLLTTQELNFGFFDPQAGQISGSGYLAGSNHDSVGFELAFGFVSSNESAAIVTPISEADLETAFETTRVHKITDFPKAAGANLDNLSDTAFFPNSDVQMLIRSRDGTEFYTRRTSVLPQLDTDENKLVFTEKNITGECFGLDELEKGAGNSCDGRNNADADEVFAFTIDYSDRVSCLVTNALTSRYSNGDSCDLDDIAMVITYTEGFGVTTRDIDQWYFSPSSSRSSSNLRLRNITERLGDPDDIDITASRTNLLNNSVSAEAFFLEAEYAGFALFITGGSNSFFGTSNYNDPDIALRPLFYGLEAPVVTDSYTATYEGKAIGAYMRDISGSGTNRTVDDGDRAFITGEVELTADFAESTITGSAALVAHRLNITDFVRGRVEIGFENGVIDGSSFAGDVSIDDAGTNFLDELSAGLAPDNISGFEGVIAGTGIQEISGRAIFRRNNIHILQFGFVANSTTDTIPSWVAATSVVEAAKTKLDAGDSIAQPEANSTDVFGSDTPTANTLTFPVADEALVRSPDGSEYALLPLNEDVLGTVGFSLSGRTCRVGIGNQTQVLVLNDDTTSCVGVVGSFIFELAYASGSVTCTVVQAGQLTQYTDNDTCLLTDTGVVLTETIGPSGDFTANIWRFGGSPPQAVADNASNINTIINSSAIRVLGARSNVSKNNDTLDVDAYILESTYAGFGIWAENPEDLFDATDGTYTADELSINFYGMATPAASIPSSGSATYSGKTFGIHMRDTNTDSLGFRFLISSDIDATANFTDRSVSMTFGTISAYELDYTPTTAVGTAQLTAFDVSITANSPDITGKIKVTENTTGTGVLEDFTNPSAVAEGTISGILAGPSYDEMAGTASLTEGGDVLKLGFIASKQ